MNQSRELNLIGVAGVLVYALALGAAAFTYPNFWTSQAMGDDIPWYFIGQDFVRGIFGCIGIAITVVLGLIMQARLGVDVWGRLVPALLFLSMPVGDIVNVILHTHSIWDPGTASSEWKTFAQYSSSQILTMVVTLATVTLLLFMLRRRGWLPHTKQ